MESERYSGDKLFRSPKGILEINYFRSPKGILEIHYFRGPKGILEITGIYRNALSIMYCTCILAFCKMTRSRTPKGILERGILEPPHTYEFWSRLHTLFTLVPRPALSTSTNNAPKAIYRLSYHRCRFSNNPIHIAMILFSLPESWHIMQLRWIFDVTCDLALYECLRCSRGYIWT